MHSKKKKNTLIKFWRFLPWNIKMAASVRVAAIVDSLARSAFKQMWRTQLTTLWALKTSNASFFEEEEDLKVFNESTLFCDIFEFMSKHAAHLLLNIIFDISRKCYTSLPNCRPVIHAINKKFRTRGGVCGVESSLKILIRFGGKLRQNI